MPIYSGLAAPLPFILIRRKSPCQRYYIDNPAKLRA